MSISFFDLPREIRDMIHEKVFETPRRDKKIAPDLKYTRRRGKKSLAARTINNCLALLLSCKQASEEACTALYGRNTFYFDDTKRCFLVLYKDAGHCKYCQSTGRDDRAADASSSKHDIIVPFCDMVYMHDWLSTIGEKNRMRLRHIELKFSSSTFFQTLDEWSCEGSRGICTFGGDVLGRGLELLSWAHNLETLRITFKKPSTKPRYRAEYERWSTMHAFIHLFSSKHSGHVTDSLSGITGIKRLECAEFTGDPIVLDSNGSMSNLTDEMDAARAGLRRVREAMEFGHASRLKPGESLVCGQDPDLTNWSKRWKVWSPWPVVPARWM